MKEYFSVSEVADYLGVTRQTINNWIKSGTFEAYRLPSGTYKIHRKNFLAFLKTHNLFIDKNIFPAGEQKILVIDDDEFIRLLLKEAFHDFCPECRFESAADGISGLIKIGELQPDFLFLDLDLPEMHGLEVYQKIKQNKQLGNMKIIIISGFIEDYDEDLSKIEVFGVLKKPFTLTQLRESILKKI